MCKTIKKIINRFIKPPKQELYDIQLYPTDNGGIRFCENQNKPVKLPPLMVRKAGWRR